MEEFVEELNKLCSEHGWAIDADVDGQLYIRSLELKSDLSYSWINGGKYILAKEDCLNWENPS